MGHNQAQCTRQVHTLHDYISFALFLSVCSMMEASNKLILILCGPEEGEVSPSHPSTRTHESHGTIRLQLSVPRLVDAEQANLIAAMIFEQLDQLPAEAIMERVKLSSVRFTVDGAEAIKEFLGMHASTITHVSLKNIVQGVSLTPDEVQIMEKLAHAFVASPIEILNLSENTLDSHLWENWGNQTGIRQLLLDQVHMDDDSVFELSVNLQCEASLEDIYVVLNNAISDEAMDSVCDVLSRCQSIASIRWANRDLENHVRLPWLGLREMIRSQGTPLLRHLVMDGSNITVKELGDSGLCGAIRQLKQLRTLKLRDIGLRDNGVRSVLSALRVAMPPLQWLDLCGNMIETEGANELAHMLSETNVLSTLEVLAMERNKIGTQGGSSLLRVLSSRVNDEFDLRMNDNPMNYGKIALTLARVTHSAKSNMDNSAELQQLREECEVLRREKDTLKSAFGILGSPRMGSDRGISNDGRRSIERSTQASDTSVRSNRSSSSPRHKLSFDTPTSTTMPIELTTPSSRASTLSSLTGYRSGLPTAPSIHSSLRPEGLSLATSATHEHFRSSTPLKSRPSQNSLRESDYSPDSSRPAYSRTGSTGSRTLSSTGSRPNSVSSRMSNTPVMTRDRPSKQEIDHQIASPSGGMRPSMGLPKGGTRQLLKTRSRRDVPDEGSRRIEHGSPSGR